jgi:hypothetical protein
MDDFSANLGVLSPSASRRSDFGKALDGLGKSLNNARVCFMICGGCRSGYDEEWR